MDFLNKATRYCSLSEHCDSEIRLKLFQWGCLDEQQQDEIIEYLHEENYINNSRFCRAFVHDKLLYQGWGRLKIRMALKEKKLPDNDIVDAFAQINEDEYFQVLSHLIEQKKRQTKGEGQQEKLLRFALSRGFLYDEIKKFI